MSAPVKHTCPDIDKVIKTLNRVIKEIDYRRKIIDKNSEEDDILYGIASDISDIPDILEDLRNANDSLRTWGEGLDKELNNAVDEIYELEQKVEELQKQTD